MLGVDSVAFEVFYMYLVYTPDGIVLVSRSESITFPQN